MAFASDTIPMTRHAFRVGAAAIMALAACSPDSLVKTDPPSAIIDGRSANTPVAATALYNGVLNAFAATMAGSGNAQAADDYIVSSGTMTDEFISGPGSSSPVDTRTNFFAFSTGSESGQSGLYLRLQLARVGAYQARVALQNYGADGSTPRIGRMYAMEAYSILLLAEYFCNGIPLSQTPVSGNPVYEAGETTTQLLTKAVALFDTAITLSADSSEYQNLAKVGKGRALLDLGDFAGAGAAVAGVPLTFVSKLELKAAANFAVGGVAYSLTNQLAPPTGFQAAFLVMDNEGGKGLKWSGDVRTPAVTQSFSGTNLWVPKYLTQSDPIRLADGLEASLIRAEVAFNTGTGTAWLDTLNALRANCTTLSGCAPIAGVTAAGLPALADSSTQAGRLRLLMSERAHWLFATGHRQGDLRRMLRAPYGAPPFNFTSTDVYPSGAYVNSGYTGAITSYGPDVVAIPARSEQQYNSKYTGCFDQNP